MELLINKIKEFDIELNEKQIELFGKYFEFLNKFNEHTNIVSDASYETVMTKHFADSISLYLDEEIREKKNLSIIDIGCGGGFPGVPLIILFDTWTLTAVDSVGKKINFIKELAEILELTDRIKTVNGRAEDLAHTVEMREKFDISVARAVSRLNILCEYCLPFVKKDGIFAAYKAKEAQEELNEAQKALQTLKGESVKQIDYSIENTDRNILIIKKVGNTSSHYPRKAGIPKKKPL
ncbi:MAG: 16S rRNA (guanine(527)-N(7))-methyltransferase RsmG [bacterium]